MEVRNIGKNIKKMRESRRITQKQLGEMIQKGESAIGNYETGSTDIPLSALLNIANAFKCRPEELFGVQVEKSSVIELKIYTKEDRLNVAQILIDNGYTVRQGKRQRTPTGKTLDYFLKVAEDGDNADTAK